LSAWPIKETQYNEKNVIMQLHLYVLLTRKLSKIRDKNYDRLWKMRTVFDKQDNANSKYYNPTESLALNEIIVLFKCTLVCKNWSYIPKKNTQTFWNKNVHAV